MKIRARSADYQYKILEKSYNPADLKNMIIHPNNDFPISEDLKQLRERLCERTCEIALSLKEDDYNILKAKYDGDRTQMEIAEMLGSNQASICKRLTTIIKKLKKKCYADQEILELLEKINQVQE